MNVAIQEILNTALQLPDKDRADLAASLIDSLDPSLDAAAKTAWAEEVERRLGELDSGTVRPIPWEQARPIIAGRAV